LSQIVFRLLFFQSLLAFSPSLAPMRLSARKTDRNWLKSLKSEGCSDTVPDMKVEDPEWSASGIVPQARDAQDLSISYLREVCTSYKQTIYFCDDFKENAEIISVCKPWKPDADVSAFGYLHDRQTPCLLIPGL